MMDPHATECKNFRTLTPLRAIELPSTVRALPMTSLHEGTQDIAVAIGSGRDPDEIVALAMR